jgi:hypothetical protein
MKDIDIWMLPLRDVALFLSSRHLLGSVWVEFLS